MIYRLISWFNKWLDKEVICSDSSDEDLRRARRAHLEMAKKFCDERERCNKFHRRVQRAESTVAYWHRQYRVLERENYLLREAVDQIRADNEKECLDWLDSDEE